MARVANGKIVYLSPIDGQTYDDVAILAIDVAALHPAFLKWQGNKRNYSEVTYKGIIPASAVRHMVRFPVTQKLQILSWEILHGGVDQYIGMDIIVHLGGTRYDIQAE